jgi:hypothetical protein
MKMARCHGRFKMISPCRAFSAGWAAGVSGSAFFVTLGISDAEGFLQ